jgi:hypothetical protein
METDVKISVCELWGGGGRSQAVRTDVPRNFSSQFLLF